MPHLQLPDIRIYYDEWTPLAAELKTAVPIVLLHGFTIDRRMWRPQVEYFKKFYRVIAVDARGHGLSDSPETNYGRAYRVSDIIEMANALGIGQMHLVGLSMGGTTAIGCALDHPDRLRSLTLISTGAAGYHPGKKIDMLDKIAREKGVEATMRKWIEVALSWYEGEQQQIIELMKTMMSEHTGRMWVDPQRGNYPRTNDLDNAHQIRTPTLILNGSLDKIFVPLAEKLHELIPDNRYYAYEGIGHMLNLEAPERCNADLKKFFEEVEA